MGTTTVVSNWERLPQAAKARGVAAAESADVADHGDLAIARIGGRWVAAVASAPRCEGQGPSPLAALAALAALLGW